MWEVARRPRWIAALVFALAVAAGFAALGQWQLARSISSGQVVERATETVLPLSEVTEPQAPMSATADGQLVSVRGAYVDDDWMLVSDRVQDGDLGYWVIGHLVTGDAAGSAGADAGADGVPGAADLVVALGWAPTEKRAASALAGLRDDFAGVTVEVTGRYAAGESPVTDDLEDGARTAVSPPSLVNEWSESTGSVYGGYLIADADAPGLDSIDAPAPGEEVALNWLNVFYAVEWVVFAGFAIFMWYRLVRDAWERETELAAQATTVN